MQNQDELTPEERELERALKTLRPTAARIDSAALARAVSVRAKAGPVRVWAAAAAALVAGAGLWLATGPHGPVSPETAVRSASNGSTADDDWEPPTEIVYRRAIMQSPAALDALLDRQSRASGTPDVDVARAGTATFWNVNFYSSSGDL